MQQTHAAVRAADSAVGVVAPDYAALFVKNISRSVQAALTRVQQDPSPVLAEETRERALHVLSYSLKLPALWSQTRSLLLALAPKLEQAGYRGEWLPYLVRGLAVSVECHDVLGGAELRLHLGHLHRLQSRWAPARDLLTASAKAFAALGERRGEARALNQLAYVAWQQHQHDEVADLAQRALALLDETDVERATSLSALGLAAIEQHRWQEAEAYHRAALQIRTQDGDQRLMAWSLQNLGYALRGQDKYEDAIACYESAISTLAALDDVSNCANVQINLGIVYSLQGKPAKALEVYAAAETIFRRIGDQWHLAKVFVNQGIDYTVLRNWQRAETVLMASANLFQQLGDLSEYLNARYELGVSYQERGLYAKALVIFESVAAQLPQIEGTHYHRLLAKVIDTQLEQAKAGSAAGEKTGKV